MADSKPKTRTTSRSTKSTRSTARNGSGSTPRSDGSKRSTKSSSAGRSSARSRTTSNRSTTAAQSNGKGVAGTVKQAASKAKGPAIAAGAAAAGIAGGLVLKGRARRRTVLGIRVPKQLPAIDPKSVAHTVGEASLRFAKTSKTVSKDIDRAAEQAERIGKILK